MSTEAKTAKDKTNNNSIQSMPLLQFAKESLPHCNLNALKRDLKNLGYLKGHTNGRPYRVNKKLSQGLFVEQVVNEAIGEIEIGVTVQGKKLLRQLFKSRQLTVKSSSPLYGKQQDLPPVKAKPVWSIFMLRPSVTKAE